MFDFQCHSKNANRVEQWEQHSKQEYRNFYYIFILTQILFHVIFLSAADIMLLFLLEF